jgi:hypothetical protein
MLTKSFPIKYWEYLCKGVLNLLSYQHSSTEKIATALGEYTTKRYEYFNRKRILHIS